MKIAKNPIVKLSETVQPLKAKVETAAENTVSKIKQSVGGGANLERAPKRDIYTGRTKSKRKKNNGSRLGDFLVENNKRLAEIYKKDLANVAQEIPQASFMPEFNKSSAKELESILDKMEKRSAQFLERGYNGVIRDGVRSMIFLPEADKNYMQVVKAMEKKGYRVAETFAEDANGNIILDAAGKPKMKPDIDIRFGENAARSGYEDVQIRFEKGGNLYELLILPGPNYAAMYKIEHELFYEPLRKYDVYKFTKDKGSKAIVKAIKKEFHSLTKRLYQTELARDIEGSKAVSDPVTFSKENINNLNGLFRSLKNLWCGRFNSLPPSKQTQPFFEWTRIYRRLDELEQRLREPMNLYKPIN